MITLCNAGSQGGGHAVVGALQRLNNLTKQDVRDADTRELEREPRYGLLEKHGVSAYY